MIPTNEIDPYWFDTLRGRLEMIAYPFHKRSIPSGLFGLLTDPAGSQMYIVCRPKINLRPQRGRTLELYIGSGLNKYDK